MSVTTIRNLTAAEYMRDPAAFRSTVTPLLLAPAIQAIAHGCAATGPFKGKPPQRWAVRLAMQIAGWTDTKSEVSVVLKLAQDYGLRDESDIRSRLELAGKVQTLNLDEAQARAEDLLRRIIAADPSRREAIEVNVLGRKLLQDNAESA